MTHSRDSRTLEQEYITLLRQAGIKPLGREPWYRRLAPFSKSEFSRRDLAHSREVAEREGLGFDWLNVLAPLARRNRHLFNPESKAGLQPVIDGLCEEIEEGMQACGLSVPMPVLVREFPTGDFNACACRLSSGAAVLINTGLMRLIDQTTSVFGSSVDAGGGKTLHTWQKTVLEMTDAIVRYLRFGDPRFTPDQPVAGGKAGFIGAILRRECEKFVIAHEFAHAICGHLDHDGTNVLKTIVGDMMIVRKEWQDEYEADLLAARILLASAKVNPGLRAVVGDENYDAFPPAAMTFFFALDNLVHRVRHAICGSEDTRSTDHPPSSERLARIRGFVIEQTSAETINNGDMVNDWVTRVGDAATEVVRKPEAVRALLRGLWRWGL